MVARTFFALDNDNLVDNTTGVGIINNSSTPNGRTFTYSNGGGAAVTLDDTGGSPDIFEDGQPGNHIVTDGGGLVAEGNGVESESFITIRELDASGSPTGPEITLVIFSQNGNFRDVWGFATDTDLVDGATYIKIRGSNRGSSEYTEFVTCFAAGTLIEGADGLVPVEDINVGDMVWTRDGGFQPVQWISSTTVAGAGNFAPVVFEKNTLGNAEELIVSQQHRMLISGPLSELLFDTHEALVAAKHLVGLEGVSLVNQPAITYCHFMFDRHHIVRANGYLTESFFLADGSVNALDMGARDELLALFPSLKQGYEDFGKSALMTLTAREAAVWRNAQAHAA